MKGGREQKGAYPHAAVGNVDGDRAQATLGGPRRAARQIAAWTPTRQDAQPLQNAHGVVDRRVDALHPGTEQRHRAQGGNGDHGQEDRILRGGRSAVVVEKRAYA